MLPSKVLHEIEHEKKRVGAVGQGKRSFLCLHAWTDGDSISEHGTAKERVNFSRVTQKRYIRTHLSKRSFRVTEKDSSGHSMVKTSSSMMAVTTGI